MKEQQSNNIQRLKRRVSYETLSSFIHNAELEFPMLCDDFDDAFEYTDAVISHAVDNFMTMDEDIFSDENYDDIYDIVFDLCKDWFSDGQMDIYMSTCQEEEDDEDMMFEQTEIGVNSVIVKLFKILNEEKKKKKTRKELLEVVKKYSPYFNIPPGFELYILELYLLNYRKDGDYSSLTKDNFVDPKNMKGKVTSNTKADLYTKAQLPFRGSNLEGYWKNYRGKKYYVVQSWGWYPVFIFRDGIWYENIDRFSSSTSRQMYRSQPYDYNNSLDSKVYLLTRNEMDMIENGDSHEEVMKSKREKLKKLEPELKAKKLTTDRPFLGWNVEVPNFNIKFKVNSVEEGDDKLTVNIDIYDVVKRVNGKGVPTPENYLKGEIRDVSPQLVEDKLKKRLRRDLKNYIGPKYENAEDGNIEFKFNHLKK